MRWREAVKSADLVLHVLQERVILVVTGQQVGVHLQVRDRKAGGDCEDRRKSNLQIAKRRSTHRSTGSESEILSDERERE